MMLMKTGRKSFVALAFDACGSVEINWKMEIACFI